MFFDPLYLVIALPGLLFSLWASYKTKTTFNKYSKFYSANHVSGAEAAARLLNYAGIYDVRIEETSGFLSDHYDPSDKTLRLSHDVYHSTSLSAIGVACHEAGHAIQHATGYEPLKMRSSLVPALNFASPMSYIFFVIGILFNFTSLVYIGIICFALCFVFALVTLPVEYNASMRAKDLMVTAGVVSYEEANDSSKVLYAAFLTYVAAAVSSLLTLLYYLWRSGLLSNNDD